MVLSTLAWQHSALFNNKIIGKVCPDKVQLNKLNITLHLLVSIKRRVIIINFMANQMPTYYLLHRLHFLNLETSKTTNCQLHVFDDSLPIERIIQAMV